MANLATTPLPVTKPNKRGASRLSRSTPQPTADSFPSGRDDKLDPTKKRALLLKLGGLVRELNKAGMLSQFRTPLKEIEQGITDA